MLGLGGTDLLFSGRVLSGLSVSGDVEVGGEEGGGAVEGEGEGEEGWRGSVNKLKRLAGVARGGVEEGRITLLDVKECPRVSGLGGGCEGL